MFKLRGLYHLSLITQRAFTLFEMLVVLLIIGLSSSVVMMNTKPNTAPQTPAIIEFFEKERVATLLNNQVSQIQLENNRLYATGSKNSFPLPDRKLAAGNRYLPYFTLVTFYPDGTQAASKFTLQTETHTYEIETSPFTNKIQYTEHENT